MAQPDLPVPDHVNSTILYDALVDAFSSASAPIAIEQLLQTKGRCDQELKSGFSGVSTAFYLEESAISASFTASS